MSPKRKGLRGYQPDFYNNLRVFNEAQEALWDTVKMTVTHPKSWVDVAGLGIAGAKQLLRGSSTTSQLTTQSFPHSETQSTMPFKTGFMGPRKRARTGGSSITSTSTTGYGQMDKADQHAEYKVSDRAKHIIGLWKKKRVRAVDMIDALFPTFTLKERYIPLATEVINSDNGKQGVFDNTGFAAMTCALTQSYMRAIYTKLIREVNTLGSGVLGHIPNVGWDNSASNQTTMLPDLHITAFSRKYTVQNTGSFPASITFFEYLCKENTSSTPSQLWAHDLDAQFHKPIGDPDLIGTLAPTTSQTRNVLDPGALPPSSGKSLKRFFSETRRTTYDVPSGGIIVHSIYHEGASIPVVSFYGTDDTIQQEVNTFIAGATRAYMIVTNGIRGWDEATKALGDDDNKIVSTASYWNIQVDTKTSFRAPFRQKAYTYMQVVANDDGSSWTTTASDYRESTVATGGLVSGRDSDTGSTRRVQELDD